MTRQDGELLTDADRRKNIFKEGCTPASREKWAQMRRAGVFWGNASLGGVQRFLHKCVQKFIPAKSRIPVCYMQYRHRLANVFSLRFVWFWVKLKNISFWLKQLHWNICSLQLLEGLPEAEKAFAVLLTSSAGSLPEICKLNPRWYRYLCQKTRTACFAISAFNFLLITCSVPPTRRNVLIHHWCLCSHALFGQNQESKGHSSFFPGAQRWDAEDHHNQGGVDQKQGVPTQDREDQLCGASLPGQAVSTVSRDEIELFVQIMAKQREESVWLETTTEVIRRSSKITAADWLKGKAVLLPCAGQGSAPGSANWIFPSYT